jgi:serine/threonine protein kinase/tetratricopeptide (TPR) repeat protein
MRDRAEQILAGALRQPTHQRLSYLAAECGSNVGLRRRIQALLDELDPRPLPPEQAAGPPPPAQAPDVPPPPVWQALPPAGRVGVASALKDGGTYEIPVGTTEGPIEGAGTRIGPYRLLKSLGVGGFGIVYLAEQVEPIARRVALKIIKPGMDSRQVVARFELERQTLALLEHPSIARILDGGATDSGRPYFVMELVEGVPITTFCDRKQLDACSRLKLFSEVCEAVQHAHQRGVIHRDLKPGNILVSYQDDRPLPRIIDFGIAKVVQRPMSDPSLTVDGQIIGTPAYMSPEQAGLCLFDIDTRSDVYSLGVLLYELLTGTTPFTPRRLVRGGLENVRRILSEEDPPRPSVRVSALIHIISHGSSSGWDAPPVAWRSGSDSGGAAPADVHAATTPSDWASALQIAERRRMSPAGLRKLVRGDLDRIVMKCLERDRGRRYASVSDLSDDIGRFLRNEPVLAVGPGVAYRLSKFVRRHRQGVTIAGVLAGLLAGLLGVSVQWRSAQAEAERERRSGELARMEMLRERETAASNQRRAQARDLFRDATSQFSWDGAAEALRSLERSLQLDPSQVDAALLRGQALLRLNRLDDAVAQATALLAQPLGARGGHQILAVALQQSAPAAAREHAAVADSVKSLTAEEHYLAALSTYDAKRLSESGSTAEELEHLDQAMLLDPGHFDALFLRSLHSWWAKQFDLMLADALRALSARPSYSRAWAHAGGAYLYLKRLPEAREMFARAIQLDPDNARAWYHLGYIALKDKDPITACHAFERAATLESDRAAGEPAASRVLITSLENWAIALRSLERWSEARACYDRLSLAKPTDHWPCLRAAGMSHRLGEWSEVFAGYECAVRRAPSETLPRHLLAWACLVAPPDQGRDAARGMTLAQELWDRDPSTEDLRGTLAVAKYRAGQFAEALALAQPIVDKKQRSGDWFVLALCQLGAGERSLAAQSYESGCRALNPEADAGMIGLALLQEEVRVQLEHP